MRKRFASASSLSSGSPQPLLTAVAKRWRKSPKSLKKPVRPFPPASAGLDRTRHDELAAAARRCAFAKGDYAVVKPDRLPIAKLRAKPRKQKLMEPAGNSTIAPASPTQYGETAIMVIPGSARDFLVVG